MEGQDLFLYWNLYLSLHSNPSFASLTHSLRLWRIISPCPCRRASGTVAREHCAVPSRSWRACPRPRNGTGREWEIFQQILGSFRTRSSQLLQPLTKGAFQYWNCVTKVIAICFRQSDVRHCSNIGNFLTTIFFNLMIFLLISFNKNVSVWRQTDRQENVYI